MELKRCKWINNDPLYIRYHDEEWGVPVQNDRLWFEFITLDAFQAGLSWYTIIKKRENFRKAFDNFEPEKVALFDDNRIEALMEDTGIIRNRLKIRATVSNAKAFLRIQSEFGSFDEYIWQFTDHKTIVNEWQNRSEVPAKTELSDRMSKDLTKRGFKFVGTTICYAFMQAAGIVNDHTVDCYRHSECKHLAKK
ncbi:MAG: DNA-3-methyladenine glycosylase I [Bacteroidia bacterium]|nr:DNA-3-methyladenine glycosylase I [Bacteroidia bacterium]